MNKSKTKRSIYMRIFIAFLATYLVLMIGFTAFLVSLEKEAAGKEFEAYLSQMSKRMGEILSDSLDDNNHITDIAKIKKEFVKRSPVFMLPDAEAAIFTSDYNLIYSTNDYWRCIYAEYKEENTSYDEYGLLNPKEWFSEKVVNELEDYLYAKPKAKKAGDLYGYSLHIDGWINDEMIIPDKIYVDAEYADEFDEEGNVIQSSGKITYNNVYSSSYEGTSGLPYFEHGIILEPEGKLNSKNQHELRQMVTDESKLKNHTEKITFSAYPIEKEWVSMLTYRYYMAVPYESKIKLTDNSSYSDFWTAVGIDINIWERVSSTLAYVWIFCLIVFVVVAYILSRQTYKIYLKQQELDLKRKEMTDALAHDLKTPLSIISGYAQNLQEDVHTEKREHYARHIQANVYRMDKIIKKMLEMSKLDSGSFEIRFEGVSLNEISSGIINRYKNICEEKSITAYITGEAVIKADKSLIERVIDNFFINALDNMHGGGTIHILIQDDTFELYNSGSHIPENILDDIWLPYKKGNAERSNTKGSGLGLSIVRTILELHKFPYGAKNKEDGVTFWFKFK